MSSKKERDRPLVLTVDDDILMRMTITKILEDIADVIGVPNTYDAEDQMLLHDPDLVLLDDIMPNCPTGLSFLERLKDDEALAHIPVVMVTASDKESEIERGMAAGAVAYITKPVDITLLKETVVKILSYRPKRIGIFIQDDDLAASLEETFLYLKCDVVMADEFSDMESWTDSPDLLVVDDAKAYLSLWAREGWKAVSFVVLDAMPENDACLKEEEGKRVSFMSSSVVLGDIVRQAGYLLRAREERAN